MARDGIRVGLVGCGRIARAHLAGIRTLLEHEVIDVRVTALCARDVDKAARLLKRGDEKGRGPIDPEAGVPSEGVFVDDFQTETPRVYAHLEDLLEDEAVDAALILTSVNAHHAQTIAALVAGVHVMVEKPMAITVRAATRMLEIAEETERVLAVAESARFLLSTRLAQWAVRSGAIGRLQAVLDIGFGHPAWSPNACVAGTPWRHEKLRAGAGIVLDAGIHRLHVLRAVAGEVTEIAGRTALLETERVLRDERGQVRARIPAGVEDAYFATLRFAGGALGTVSGSWSAHGGPVELPGTPRYYGTKGCVAGDALRFDDGGEARIEEHWKAAVGAAEIERLFPRGITDPFALEILSFLRAIEGGGAPEVSGREGLKDLALAYALIESSLAGRTVSPADVEGGRIDAYQREINAHCGI
ncbi:MAG: Gfo/Idh/MocA family oxidoreductase [Planctomycetes bacterium]|nr:Gfo/Idh/MocA family oxidoreductase [Planctomycetota bacterium]